MMRAYTYDGTFDGYLTCVYQIFASGALKDKDFMQEMPIFKWDRFIPSLLFEECFVETDPELVDKVVRKFAEIDPYEILHHVTYAFLTEDPSAESVIMRYMIKQLREKKSILNHLQDPDVYALFQLSRKVGRECHLMLGLVRFSEIKGGIFYAKIEPTYNIIPSITRHFIERLNDQPWIIHDGKRNYAAFYDTKKCFTALFEEQNFKVEYTKEEEQIRMLWKGYFETIAIEERKNPSLQSKMMPKKYWKYLTEKAKEISEVRDVKSY